MQLCDLQKATRADVLAYFRNTWNLTSSLFSALKTDAVFYSVPDKLRRPLMFYFCHPAAVYINKMHLAGLVESVNPFLQKLYETGVDEMSWDDMDAMQSEDFAWPDLDEACQFRDACKTAVEAAIMKMPPPCSKPVTMDSPWWALFMGFEHERIHLETSSVLIRQLPVDSVEEPAGWRTAPTFARQPGDAPANALVTVPAGPATIGKPLDFPSFGWDNEYGQRDVAAVPEFKASRFLVTNAEFLPFVLAGGYEQRQWWVSPAGDDEGWRWREYRNATHPSFWVATSHPESLRFHGGRAGAPYQKDDGHPLAGTDRPFKLRAEFRIIDMPWDWPVEVNYLEATAFLRWKEAMEAEAAGSCRTPRASYRLPTEAEYHRLRAEPSPLQIDISAAPELPRCCAPCDPALAGKVFAAPDLGARDEPSASARFDIMLRDEAPGNVNMRWGSSTPVNAFPPSAAGFYDAHGNVWQWAEDHFAPLPGFAIHYLYDDFSSPCFDGWHTVILGGSWVSTGDLASSFARYHFRRHFFQHCGFRYVRVDESEPYAGAATVTNLWEKSGAVGTLLSNAFGPPQSRLGALKLPAEAGDAMTSADVRLASLTAAAAVEAGLSLETASVLHLGCGVGGASFELARAGFRHVTGVDENEPAIRHARIMRHHGQFEYDRVTEGVLTESVIATVPEGADRSKVVFELGDVTAVSGAYDVVLVDNLVTRLTQPLSLLARLVELVRPGGILVIASDNNWDPSITPRNSWCGGFKMNGEDMSTLHMLTYNLKRAFVPFGVPEDVPRLTRLHNRRFTVDVLQVSAWKRV